MQSIILLQVLFLLFYKFLFHSASSDNTLGLKVKEANSSWDEENEVVKRRMFPDDFLFGATTSAYQIEGAFLEDGKSLNNWDVFSQIPGSISNGDNAYVADDHYHLYAEDLGNLKMLGVNAYRFSISWARILPKGRFGELNSRGVAFYTKILDDLLLLGIEPVVTIHHGDFPQEHEDRFGSWLSNSMQEEFVHFAMTCFEKFGDKVKYWITINEPNLFSDMAYIRGNFPPGHCSLPFGNCSKGNSNTEPLIAAHNMLLSHAKAVQLYREYFQPKQGGIIGIVVTAMNYEPYRDDEFSRQAVERAFAFNVAWILDPLIYGEYPRLMKRYHGKQLPKFTKEEVELVTGSVDFFGINHYATLYAVDCSLFHTFHDYNKCTLSDKCSIRGFVATTGYRDGVKIGDETANPRFFVVPQGMEKLIDYLTLRYPNTTLYVTENVFRYNTYSRFKGHQILSFHCK